MNRLTLLTDFGTADGYVGAMKGVIATIAPTAQIDDISHDLNAGDVQAAAFSLSRYWKLFPVNTIHVAVVDPGVGSSRRPIVARVDNHYIVAPDNGIITRVLERAKRVDIVAIENPAYMRSDISDTFHGRDIFAPVAAHLHNGRASFNRFGPSVTDPVKLQIPGATADSAGMRGEVVYVDRFGNLVTNISGDFARGCVIYLREREIGPVSRAYAAVRSGEPVAVIGSDGMLEISVRDGNAAQLLDAGRRTLVTTRLL